MRNRRPERPGALTLAALSLLGAAVLLAGCGEEDEGGTGLLPPVEADLGPPEGTPVALGEFCEGVEQPVCNGGKSWCLPVYASGVMMLCTSRCTVDDDCPGGLRCIDAGGTSRLCMATCRNAGDCPTWGQFFCADTATPGVGVCWTGQEDTGEIHFASRAPELTNWSFGPGTTGLPESDSPRACWNAGGWRLVPGLPVALNVSLSHTGSKRLVCNWTLRSSSPFLSVVAGATGVLTLPQGASLQGATAVGSFSVEVQSEPGVPTDEPLALELVLEDDVSKQTWQFPLVLTSRESRAALRLVPPRITQAGDGSWVVSLLAQNDGFGGLAGARVQVAVAGAGPEGTLTAELPSLPDQTFLPGPRSPILLATVPVRFQGGLGTTLLVTVTDPAGFSWTESLFVSQP